MKGETTQKKQNEQLKIKKGKKRKEEKRNDESSQLVTVYQAVRVSRSRNRLGSADRNTGWPYEATLIVFPGVT